MKKTLKVTGFVFLVLVLVVTSFSVWQWENIKSIYLGITQSAEEIDNRRIENQKTLITDLNEYMDVPVREMTEEEKKKVESGEMTITEVYSTIFTEKGSVGRTETPSSGSNSPGSDSSGTLSEKDKIISEAMSVLYGLQSEFTARAEATISSGDRYYESIKEHPQDSVARAKTITHFTPIVRAIEAEQ